ncbi:MAG: hypothetical protein ACYCX8_09375, partial [Acidimicrobiales bacterium]
ESVPTLSKEHMEVNDAAARACFARTLRQLRSATMLVMWGYYSEVGLVLRGAFESASLGRMLAKAPEKAERWLQKGQWFPQSDVRGWLRAGGADDDTMRVYTDGYRVLSAWAHPTAMSCASLVDFSSPQLGLQLYASFDEGEFRRWVREITATSIFACFALRNAAVDETVLSPAWRHDLYALGEAVSHKTLPHLHRDWDAEKQRYEEYRSKVQPVTGIDDRLSEHPRSWHNISKGRPM